jgi:hypothetical protein
VISRDFNAAPPSLTAKLPALAALDPVLSTALSKDPPSRTIATSEVGPSSSVQVYVLAASAIDTVAAPNRAIQFDAATAQTRSPTYSHLSNTQGYQLTIASCTSCFRFRPLFVRSGTC